MGPCLKEERKRGEGGGGRIGQEGEEKGGREMGQERGG